VPEPVPAGGSAIERILRQDGLLTLVGLLVLCALAWAYLASGARTGMSASEMTTLALFPQLRTAELEAGMAGMDMTPALDLATWWLLAAMWLAMMVAMMTPSAAPAMLLYARVHAHHGGPGAPRAPLAAFALGYLAVWSAISQAAASLQLWSERHGVVSTMTMGVAGRWPAAVVLIAAGLYQLTPLKRACLAECRSPAQFLSQHFRPGASGAFRLGLRHGAWCLGCCWLLMALLFVGGVMNLVWIALIAILVGIEKLAGPGRAIGIAVGLLLVAWGVATAFA
jgi:predicted metal-binding membrane protein